MADDDSAVVHTFDEMHTEYAALDPNTKIGTYIILNTDHKRGRRYTRKMAEQLVEIGVAHGLLMSYTMIADTAIIMINGLAHQLVRTLRAVDSIDAS